MMCSRVLRRASLFVVFLSVFQPAMAQQPPARGQPNPAPTAECSAALTRLDARSDDGAYQRAANMNPQETALYARLASNNVVHGAILDPGTLIEAVMECGDKSDPSYPHLLPLRELSNVFRTFFGSDVGQKRIACGLMHRIHGRLVDNYTTRMVTGRGGVQFKSYYWVERGLRGVQHFLINHECVDHTQPRGHRGALPRLVPEVPDEAYAVFDATYERLRSATAAADQAFNARMRALLEEVVAAQRSSQRYSGCTGFPARYEAFRRTYFHYLQAREFTPHSNQLFVLKAACTEAGGWEQYQRELGLPR